MCQVNHDKNNGGCNAEFVPNKQTGRWLFGRTFFMKRSSYLVSLFLFLSLGVSDAFNAHYSWAIRPAKSFWIGHRHHDQDRHVAILVNAGNNNDWDREIDEKVMRRLQREGGSSGGMGETAAGAVLGGLLLGPFGTCLLAH
jgi:hypothetical protein